MAEVPVRRTPAVAAPVWEPWSEMQRLAREMSSLVQGWDGTVWRDGLSAADLEETDDAYLLEVELPGVKKGDVAVELTGRRLRVRAERQERERTGVVHRRAAAYGRFEYEILLPGEADAERAQANLEDGVLRLRLPKVGAERSRRIAVT
ncbi:MAG: Hsp20/alpha crystallin family protein [Firmicutes bacterium]|nr:Hsp20/alpha crystallin family protein [Bacillota bacterium]